MVEHKQQPGEGVELPPEEGIASPDFQRPQPTHEQDVTDIRDIVREVFDNHGMDQAIANLGEFHEILTDEEVRSIRRELKHLPTPDRQAPSIGPVLSLEAAEQLLQLATIARRNAHELLVVALQEEQMSSDETVPLPDTLRNAANLYHLTDEQVNTAEKILHIHKTEPERIRELAGQFLAFAIQSEYYASNISADAQTLATKIDVAKTALEGGMNIMDVLRDPELGPKKPSPFAPLASITSKDIAPKKSSPFLRPSEIQGQEDELFEENELERDVSQAVRERDRKHKESSYEHRQSAERKSEARRIAQQGDFKGDVELAQLWINEGRTLAFKLVGMAPEERDEYEIPAHLEPILYRIVEEVEWFLKYEDYEVEKKKLETVIITLYTESKAAYKALLDHGTLTQETIDHLTNTYLIPLHDKIKERDGLYDKWFGKREERHHVPEVTQRAAMPEIKELHTGTAPQWVAAFRKIGISQKTLENPALFLEMLSLATQKAQEWRAQKRANIQEAQRLQYEASQKAQKGEISATESLRVIAEADKAIQEQDTNPF